MGDATNNRFYREKLSRLDEIRARDEASMGEYGARIGYAGREAIVDRRYLLSMIRDCEEVLERLAAPGEKSTRLMENNARLLLERLRSQSTSEGNAK